MLKLVNLFTRFRKEMRLLFSVYPILRYIVLLTIWIIIAVLIDNICINMLHTSAEMGAFISMIIVTTVVIMLGIYIKVSDNKK